MDVLRYNFSQLILDYSSVVKNQSKVLRIQSPALFLVEKRTNSNKNLKSNKYTTKIH